MLVETNLGLVPFSSPPVTYVREAERMENMRIVVVFVVKVQTLRGHDN